MNKKGDSLAFVIALVLVFVVGLLYIGLRQAVDVTYETMSTSNYNFSGGNHADSAEKLYTMFKWFPIITLLAIFLWLILASLRRNPDGAI